MPNANGLNVALIGYGMAGKVFHAPLIATTPGLLLHSVVSSAPAKVHLDFPDVRVLAGPSDAFADETIDLVVIATPDHMHAEQAHAALEAGKHVVVDKPFAVSADEARGVVQHAATIGRFLSVFQNRRWDSDFLTLRRLIEGGTLGEVLQFESHFDRYRPKVLDRWKDQRSAGVWQDLGPHLVDQALQLFGMPDAVFADLAVQKKGGAAVDYFHVSFRYDRLRVLLHASQMTPASDLRFAVHGSRGSFIKHGADPQEAALAAGQRPDGLSWGADHQSGVLTEVLDDDTISVAQHTCGPGNYPAYYIGVRDALLKGAPNPVRPEEALAVMDILEAGRRSAEERREVWLG